MGQAFRPPPQCTPIVTPDQERMHRKMAFVFNEGWKYNCPSAMWGREAFEAHKEYLDAEWQRRLDAIE